MTESVLFHIVVLIFFAVRIHGQSITFDVTVFQYGTVAEDISYSVVPDPDRGGVWVAGGTGGNFVGVHNGTDTTTTTYDIFIVRYDDNQQITSSYLQFGTQIDDYIRDMKLSQFFPGVMLACGKYNNSASVMAFNINYTVSVMYLEVYNTSSFFSFVVEDLSTNGTFIYAVGTLWYTGYWQPTLCKFYAANGSLVWDKLIDQLPPYYDIFEPDYIMNGLAVDPLGFVYLTGKTSEVNITLNDGWYMKVDANSSTVYYERIGSEYEDGFGQLVLDYEKSVMYVVGFSQGRFLPDATPIVIPNYDPVGANFTTLLFAADIHNGSIIWLKNQTIIDTLNVQAFMATNTNKTLLYTAGATLATSINGVNQTAARGGFFDLLIEVFTIEGDYVYGNISGSTGYEKPCAIATDANNNFWIVGQTNGYWVQAPLGQYDSVLVRGLYEEVYPQPSTSPEVQKSHSSKSVWEQYGTVIIAVAAGAVGLGAILILVAIFVKKRRKFTSSSKAKEVDMELSTSGTMYTRINSTNPAQMRSSTISVDISKLSNDWIIDYNELAVISKVGEGAFGEVMKATWRGVDVAVKKMIQSEASTNLQIQDFFTEAEMMKKIRPHFNITQLYGVCTQPLCIVTEFVANGSLHNWLVSDKPLDNDSKVKIIRGTASGMNGPNSAVTLLGMLHLHSQGVIHRDLAARNILLDSLLNPKVSDFGMSRVAFDNKSNKTETNIGPIKWMAPEALTDRLYNAKTDSWSFGVVIYEVLTRSSPYEGYNLMEIATQVATGKLSLLPFFEKLSENEHPSELLMIGKKCMEKNPADRPDFSQILKWLN